MSLIDLILNLAGLLLWVSWRYVPFDPLTKIRPATLTGTLRRAEPLRVRRWHFLAALLCLLLVRTVFYWWLGPALDWTPSIELGAVSISFRSDIFRRMLLFSSASFGNVLLSFYLCLILLSVANPPGLEANPWQRFVRIQLGAMRHWPWALRALMPFLAMAVTWMIAAPLLAKWQIVPATHSWRHLAEQSVLLGANVYLQWKYLIGAVLSLHLLNSYVYLGSQPIWDFVNATGARLLSPLRRIPLRLGKADFAPVVGIALVFVFAEFAQRLLNLLFAELPI